MRRILCMVMFALVTSLSLGNLMLKVVVQRRLELFSISILKGPKDGRWNKRIHQLILSGIITVT